MEGGASAALEEGVDLELAPENLLELLAQPRAARGGADARSAEQLRAEAARWVGPRTKVVRSDKVRDPRTKRLTIWQLLGPLHKTVALSLLRRRAAEAGVDARALQAAERAACPRAAILKLHIERSAGAAGGATPRATALQELRRDLAAVQLKARTEGHYLLIHATSAPASAITIQCLEGLAESVATFQALVAEGIARHRESAPPSRPASGDWPSTSGLGPPRAPEAEPQAGPPLVEAPVATLQQRIVDLGAGIEAAGDAARKDALRKRQGALERRLAELAADRPASGTPVTNVAPWARGLEEPPTEQKDLGPRAGGVVLVYSQQQRLRLGVTEMGDPVPGEHRDGRSAAQRMFDKHSVSMTRMRQLAEDEPLAMALNGSRFNAGGLEAEREEARGWLQQWANIGWDVRASVELMWQGEQDFSRLAGACEDRMSRPLLRLILNAELGPVMRHTPSDAVATDSPGEQGVPDDAPAPSAAAAYAVREGHVHRSALHSPTAFIPTPPSSGRTRESAQGAATKPAPSGAGDRARRSKDMRDRISGDLRRLDGSKAATEALFASESTMNAACSAAPMLSADEIRRNIRRPELRLAQAVARSDQAAVEKLLDAGAALGPCDPLQPGWTPLHEAAQRGNLEILKLLIRHGASPDAVDELTGATPFLWACYCGHADCVKEMLLDGAPTPSSVQMNWSIPGPNLQRHLSEDDVGRTGLQVARLKRNYDVVEVLLMHEAQLKTEEKRKRWYYMSRQQQETLAEDYGVKGPPESDSIPSPADEDAEETARG